MPFTKRGKSCNVKKEDFSMEANVVIPDPRQIRSVHSNLCLILILALVGSLVNRRHPMTAVQMC